MRPLLTSIAVVIKPYVLSNLLKKIKAISAARQANEEI